MTIRRNGLIDALGEDLNSSRTGDLSIAEQTRQNRERNIPKPAFNENGKPILTSVWIPSTEQLHEYRTDPFLKSIKLTGRTFPHVVENLVLLYTDEGDIVYDPMMGTGTTLYIGHRLNRDVRGSDLNSARVRLFEERWRNYVGGKMPSAVPASAEEIPMEDNSVQLLIMSFPWFDSWTFGETKTDASMENRKSFDEFLEQAKKVYVECGRVVKPGGYIANILGNAYHKGVFYPVCMRMPQVMLDAGLELHYQFWNLRNTAEHLKVPFNRSGRDTKVKKADKGHAWDVHEDIMIARVPNE